MIEVRKMLEIEKNSQPVNLACDPLQCNPPRAFRRALTQLCSDRGRSLWLLMLTQSGKVDLESVLTLLCS